MNPVQRAEKKTKNETSRIFISSPAHPSKRTRHYRAVSPAKKKKRLIINASCADGIDIALLQADEKKCVMSSEAEAWACSLPFAREKERELIVAPARDCSQRYNDGARLNESIRGGGCLFFVWRYIVTHAVIGKL